MQSWTDIHYTSRDGLRLYARHYPPFQIGTIHLRDVVYYVAVTYMALFAAIRVMEARRWK